MAEYDGLLHAGDHGAIQELACISRIRGGDDIVGSCVWADIHEFDDNNVDIPYRQIVGQFSVKNHPQNLSAGHHSPAVSGEHY